MAIPDRIFDLLSRGLDVVWAGTFPTVVLQALWRRGHEDFVLEVRARLSEIERAARFGWIDHGPLVVDHEIDVSNADELAIAGYDAGWRGEAALGQLVAAIDAIMAEECDVALVSAAIAAPPLAAACRARLRPEEETPEMLAEGEVNSGYEMRHFGTSWARLIGATLCADDAVPSLPRIFDVMLELARSRVGAYTRDLRPGVPDEETRTRDRERLGKFVDEAPPRATPAGLRKLAWITTRLAEAGDRELAADAFATLGKKWGPPRRWAKASYDGTVGVLAACGATEDVFTVVPELRMVDRVLLAAGFGREGTLARAREQLDAIVRGEPVLLSSRARYLPSRQQRHDLDAVDLTPRDLVRLIPVLDQLAPENLREVTATISARAVEMPQLS